MGINIELPKLTELKPRITVMGIGGAGCNAINNMIATGLEGVEFVVANTDSQSLAMSSAEHHIQLGANLTEGLGAGAQPEIGEGAAEEAIDEIRTQLDGSNMLFIAAGMGGGTGTGAVPVVARIAREMKILTVAIVTKPFHFEGSRRMRVAEAGVGELQAFVDTMIVIPNQNLFRIANDKTTFSEAFVLADQVLFSGIACIVDLIVKEGLINLDFADVKTVMQGMGAAMMGTGEASGERRAVLAAELAIANPLLDDVSLQGAKGLLVSIVGSHNMTLFDVDAAVSRVKDEADQDANIIVGATFDDTLDERLRVSIVASGMAVAPSQRVLQSRLIHTTTGQTPAMVPNEISSDLGAFVSGEQGGLPHHELTLDGTPFSEAGSRSSDVARGGEQTGYNPSEADLRYNDADQGDPYLGLDTPDDFARTLSEVVGQVGSEGGERSSGSPGLPPIPAWESPDGVVIEEGYQQPSLRAAPPPLPPSRAQEMGDPRDSATFVASPPLEHQAGNRGNTPRIPEMAEFPEVAQREYRAKHSNQGRGQPSGSDELNGAVGLLKRLSMFGRRDSASAKPENLSEEQRGSDEAVRRHHADDEFKRSSTHEGAGWNEARSNRRKNT